MINRSVSSICLWALRYAVRRMGPLLAVIATMLIGVGFEVLKPWPMKLLVDYALTGRELPPHIARVLDWLPGPVTNEALINWAVAGTVGLFLLTWLLGVASAYAGVSLGQRMIYDLAADLFSHLQRLSLSFHVRKPVGDTIRRVTSDAGCVSTIVKDALLPVGTALITLCVMFGIMWQMNPRLTVLSLAVVPFMVLVFARYARPMLERSYEQQEIEGRYYNLIERTLSSMPVVQAFTREEAADREFSQSTSDNLRAMLRATAVQFRFKILIGLSTAAGTAAILWVGANEALAGRVSVGDILVFLSYLASLYAPLNTLMHTGSTIQGAAGSARRVLEVLETKHEVANPEQPRKVAPFHGDVRLENVTFGYEQGRPFIHGLTLDVSAGETIAIVGRTGAGKSTLVSMVPRFFDPWEGRVLLDGNDVRELDLRVIRQQVALVLQEPFLFPLTLAENIAYGRPSATRDEVAEAARAANAHLFIEKLPLGYETVIGERGATLSGGERQRISIARALLKNAPILILDEPTSALDAETEGLLLEALERLMRGRTTLMIAHRLSTIKSADRILVMREGRIAEQGTHAQLLAQGGIYARMQSLPSSELA